MGRRSSYDKIPRDLYESIDPNCIPHNLIKHITGKTFYEPCVGSGQLVKHMESAGANCVGGSDIKPLGDWASVQVKNGLDLTEMDLVGVDLIATNPPFSKDTLLPLIDHWTSLRPTLLLLSATHMHVKYFQPYMAKCSNVVSIGRLYFFENQWVTDYEFEYDELDKKWDKQVKFYDFNSGIKHYEGYLTTEGKPTKNKFVRGVEDYCWYLFHNTAQTTVFETRG